VNRTAIAKELVKVAKTITSAKKNERRLKLEERINDILDKLTDASRDIDAVRKILEGILAKDTGFKDNIFDFSSSDAKKINELKSNLVTHVNNWYV
jgi:hypothetical protein